MAAGSTYTPIATTTLGSSATSYTFSSIPSTYTDLVIVFNGSATSANNIYIRVNGDTGNNYSQTYLYGNGSSASSGYSTNTSNIYASGLPTSNGTLTMFINNYSNTSTYKTLIQRGAAVTDVTATVGLWRNTAAINSVTLLTDTSFASGSTFTLYGIQAA